jgi:predicted transcriptional regulator of viral defense system
LIERRKNLLSIKILLFLQNYFSEEMERLKNLGIIPVNKDVLVSLYGSLKDPKKKLSEVERKGLIIRIKRDLYVVPQKVHSKEISRELVANHLYNPSYVSLETVLFPKYALSLFNANKRRAH